MSRPEKYTRVQLRNALHTVAATGAGFFATAAGVALLEQLRLYLAPSLLSAARKLDYPLEAGEVENIVVLGLCDGTRRLAISAASAADPWAYLAVSARALARQEWGHRAWVELDETTAPQPIPAAESGLAELDKVVDAAFKTLAPLTEPRLHAELQHLLGWLALNPQTRASYEYLLLADAMAEAPSFTETQVQAVMNIAWGGRRGEPEQKRDSSLMYALLTQRGGYFRPSDFPVLLRALVQYKAAMRSRGTVCLSSSPIIAQEEKVITA